ncbi:MAG TPA: energy transducer TonB [Rhizomicrobium sp.]
MDIQSFAYLVLRLAVVLGGLLRGSVINPSAALPPHVCGVPPAVISGPNVVDDWNQDPLHPIGYLAYPPIASRHNEQGISIVTICIMPDGWVGDVVLKQSSGSTQLDAATLISVGSWHFVPAPGGMNGQPEWTDVGIRYIMPNVSPAALSPDMPPAPMLNFKDSNATRPISDPAFPHRPRYPILAVRHNEEGAVLLSFDIEDDGWPSQVQIERSSGSQQLDAMALVSVGYWHYFPATDGGKRIRTRVETRLEFKLTGGQKSQFKR